jgi:short-chain fatty acids transporter
MSFWERLINGFRAVLPSPFAIALLLTLLTFALAFLLTRPESEGVSYALDLALFWEQGLWNPPLLTFAMQMMLMLVLGHALALTTPFAKLINKALVYCNSTSNAAVLIALLTMLVGFFNWGLGLIFGAIFARKVGEYARKKGIELNYPLIGAAGYSGMLVWHGGLSGSSLVKVAEPGHLKSLMAGIDGGRLSELLPNAITFDQTVFSAMNLSVSAALLILIPGALWLVSKLIPATTEVLPQSVFEVDTAGNSQAEGAEKLDFSRLFILVIGILVLLVVLYKATSFTSGGFSFVTPDYINLVLLSLCLIFHKNLHKLMKALTEAMTGATGILIQFPLYFGIMGIMNHSGLVVQMADFFISISNQTTYPLLTFVSAGLVNFFVPSGGGQWMVQGPIVVQAAQALDIGLSKSILALAYGDQVTNMLQPFWALPLLGITGLKAKDVLPYTALMMVVGSLIFIAALLLF